MNKYIKYPLVLGTVALVSGSLLAGTHALTKDRIEKARADRQTGALGDLFEKIDSKEILEVPQDFATQGITSIVKVTSDGEIYNCYTIEMKDSVGGDAISLIIALDKNAKVYGVKILSGDTYLSKYNNSEYIATVVKNNSFDIVSGATFTGNDLNSALKLAIDCFKGKSTDPYEQIFESMTNKTEITLPQGTHSRIKKAYLITNNNVNYYAFEVKYKDSFDMGNISAIYAMNEDGTLYQLKILDGDGYSKNYDGTSDLSLVTGSTFTYNDLTSVLQLVQDCLEEVK